jgi:hypothetical protein
MVYTFNFYAGQGDHEMPLFSDFRRCVITHVLASKLLSLNGVTCHMHASKSRITSFVNTCGILWCQVCTYFSVILLVTILCTLPQQNVYLSGKVSSWMCPSSLIRASAQHISVVNMLGAQVCPATVESNAPHLHLFSWYYTYSIHFLQLSVNFH